MRVITIYVYMYVQYSAIQQSTLNLIKYVIVLGALFIFEGGSGRYLPRYIYKWCFRWRLLSMGVFFFVCVLLATGNISHCNIGIS